MLNVDQKRIFDKIKSHLISQKEREVLLENESPRLRLDNIKPLRMFISGAGGTGKSFLIEAIKCLMDDIWHPKSGETMCAIVAPTGIAAFNVGRLTIHRLFQLPIELEGKTAGYWASSKKAQKRIKMTYKFKNYNSRQGDLIQLPSVNGRAVFKKISNKLVKTRLGVKNAVNIWKETVEYDELTINERQKVDETFFNMLDSVRHGCLTDETIDTLKGRVFKVLIREKYKELESEASNPPICLFSKLDACQKINELMLESLETEKIELHKDQPSKTAGLETVLSLAVGGRVMLRRNIDVTVGLVTGAIRTVMVSNPCINESNRLRSKFREDLPQIKKSKGTKRKIQVTGIIDDGEPCSMKAKVSTSNPKKMMSSLLMKSLPIQIMLGGDKGIMFITLLMKMFNESGVRY
uniref:ATP-dependent DNA helicase n=1 Tax=Amphimedon queenslandica TaxID=400682 RepID=A0A1X7UR61_AMPQE